MKMWNPPASHVVCARQAVVGPAAGGRAALTRSRQVPLTLLAPSRGAGYNSPVPPVSQTIRVTVLFFGRLKDLLRRPNDSIAFPDAPTLQHPFTLHPAPHPAPA